MPEEIGTVDGETFDGVWRMVEEIGVQERHVNDLQAH